MNNLVFDVIVIGAGHAGLEAGFVAAKLGMKTALFNLNKQSIANLPCNPSIGGPAKGVVTREIDALGGMQGIAADANKIQIKKLNYSKGPGVWCYRAQLDKEKFHAWFLEQIEQQENLELILAEVTNIVLDQDQKIQAVQTKHHTYEAKAVIITAGTYLKAALFRNKKFADSGPDGNPNTNFLSTFLKNQGFELLRLKTGTPPRVYIDSLDYSLMQEDFGDDPNLCFSYTKPTKLALKDQMSCYLTFTTEATNKIIKENIDQAGIYNGAISGVGPRYCPSIEDKVIRFPERLNHQIFVEPISRNYDYYYVGGLSTSFSEDLQIEILKTLKGFANVRVKSFAYAIEYDAINPIQLSHTLESKKIPGLYFAGQINGTSGYEEAACQGLIAGINAALKIQQKPPFILERNEAYIGVLIDDLVIKGVKDPYRLLTSRAEHRLLLRNDNADERLMNYGYKLGLISPMIYNKYIQTHQDIDHNIKVFTTNFAATYNLVSGDAGPLTILTWIKRPDCDFEQVKNVLKDQLKTLSSEAEQKLLIKVKYQGYIQNQNQKLTQLAKWQNISLSPVKDFFAIHNLASEAAEKLNKSRPLTIKQALMISGININDVLWIKIYLEKLRSLNK